MNGVHDLGGMHGMGRVEREDREPVFHADWERRAFAITLAAGFLGRWNIDQSRQARELMPPAEYLASTYYEHWLFGLETLLADEGLVSPAEIEARMAGRSTPATKPDDPAPRLLRAADVAKVLRIGGTTRVDIDLAPRFAVGDAVIARNIHPVGHTRLPRYARGRRGVVDRDHGVFVFPDSHAMTGDPRPQHVYSVRFTARELWGREAAARDGVYVDLWDDYLDPA
jgi:nitrile hydratase subunit beta